MERRSDGTGIAGASKVGLTAPSINQERFPFRSIHEQASTDQMRTILTPGGRQAIDHPGRRGGGYLDVCTTSKLPNEAKKIARDPRLDHLRQMGMHATWQRVAAEIGMDAFLAMWRILDSEEQFHHHKGNLEINLRHYSSYEKFQRNLYIKQLAKQGGLSPKEIHYRLFEGLCEKLEPSHIKHIINNK